MTEKEEAIELVGLYYEVDGDSIYDGITWGMAKQCALVCVDEIQDTFKNGENEILYWEEIKKEINKL